MRPSSSPSNGIPYTRQRQGKLYLNYPIPVELRRHFLSVKGKEKDHIVESLGTGDWAEGRRLSRERIAHWELHFSKLRRGIAAGTSPRLRRAEQLRESMAQAREQRDDDAAFEIESRAADLAEQIEAKEGPSAARQFYKLATRPDLWTLRKAVEAMNESKDHAAGTKQKREQVLRELLAFLKVEDCLPAQVTEERAVAYVDWLNAGKLGHSTKQDRLSSLHSLWGFLARKRQVPHGSSPWVNHELTGAKDKIDKRGWKRDELLRLFEAPDSNKARHYGRPLFRELYALGLTTGMRLDEIVSLRPEVVEAFNGGFWLTIEASKTDAGVREIPVVHPAAVAILKRRLKAQKDPSASIFPECRPGGPDNKLSWHVQKAMGRDRDALGFGPEVDFHSTRRTFLTLMEHLGVPVVNVQRYVGHKVPTMMHSVYSDGAGRDNLLKVAQAVRYSEPVEAVLAAA